MSLFVVPLLMLAGGAADYWMVDDGREIDGESIVFVDKSERLDQRPDGWINFSFYEARNGSRAGAAKSTRMTAWANCKTREYINDFRMEYDSGGHMVAQGKVNEQQRRVPTPGSAEGRVLAFVCGDTRGATQLPRGTHFITYADSLYAQGHPQVARAPAPQASPRPPSPVAAPSTTAAETQKRFCDQILQLRSAASQGFRSIDLGPIKGEPAEFHATSVIRLITSDDNCFITRKGGERPSYSCSWNVYDDASDAYDEARIQAVSNMLASCLNVRPDWSEKNGQNFLEINSLGAHYELLLSAGFLMFSVEAAQPGRPSAPTNKPAASTVPARAGGTAPATRGRPEFWMVGMTEDRHTMFFVDKTSILRKPGGKAEFRREKIDNSSGKVAWLKVRSEIDCNRRISRDLEVFAYRDDETLIGAVQPAPEEAIRESTVGAIVLAFVCQGKEDSSVRLATDESTIMFFAIEQGDKGLDRSPASAPAATAPGGRPPVKPMPIGPEMCPLLRRLETLAHEDFRSIELGPDRAFGKDAAVVHRTSMPIPGAKCYIDHHEPGDPITYSCMWPVSKQAMDQFVSMVQALQKCTGGTADLTNVQAYEMPDVTMTLRGVEYRTMVTNDFLSLDVYMAKP